MSFLVLRKLLASKKDTGVDVKMYIGRLGALKGPPQLVLRMITSRNPPALLCLHGASTCSSIS